MDSPLGLCDNPSESGCFISLLANLGDEGDVRRDASLVDSFSRACGLDGAFRLVVESPDGAAVEVRDLRGPFVVVGRDPRADLVLDHPSVSRRHVYLQVLDGRVFALALGGRRGVFWDGERRDSGWVEEGQAIGVGPFRLRLAGSTAVGPPPPLPTSRAFSCAGAVDVALDFFGPNPPAGTWQVSRALVLIGYSPQCRIRLFGPEVAAIHAALVRTAEGAWLVDLLGPDGIKVGGQPERFALLGDGAVHVGPHLIGVRIGRHATPQDEVGLPALVSEQRPTRVESDLLPIFEEVGRMQDRMADQFQQALMAMFRLFTDMHTEQMTLIRQELGRIQELTEQQKAIEARLANLTPAISGERPAVAAPVRPRPAPQAPRVPGSGEAAPRPDLHLQLTQRLAALGEERQNVWQKLMSNLLRPAPDRASP